MKKASKTNLIAFVILLVGIATYTLKQEPAEPAKSSRATANIPSGRAPSYPPMEETTHLVNLRRFPIVADGPSFDPDMHHSYGQARELVLGETSYKLGDKGIESNSTPGLILFTTEDASHRNALAFDSKRERLAISSFGGEGYLEIYDLKSQSWEAPVSLENLDITALVYAPFNDSFYALEMSWGEGDTIKSLCRFNPAGELLKKTELSFPVICAEARMRIEGKGLILDCGAAEGEQLYYLNPESGEVRANFKTEYSGAEACLISIYEAGNDHDKTEPFIVNVEAGSPSILILNAYEGVRWQLQGETSLLSKIIVSGYDKPELVGAPSGCEVVNMSYEETKAYLPFACDIQSADMHHLLSSLEEQGIGVTSIACGYNANSATISKID